MTVVRPADVYGPGSRPWTVLPVRNLRAGRVVLPAGGRGVFDPIFVDGTRESHTQIGMVGGSPIILKVVSEGSDSEAFRLTHWYIDVPLTVDLIDLPGPTSLFDPNGGNIGAPVVGEGKLHHRRESKLHEHAHGAARDAGSDVRLAPVAVGKGLRFNAGWRFAATHGCDLRTKS